MADKQFAMDLAKLVIVAAWADGEVQNEELNTLKHLMLKLPDVTSEDWRELEIYLDHPVTEDEREALLQNVLSRIHTKADKERVVGTLRELVEADGVVTDEEAELLEEVRDAVEARSTGLIGAVTGLFRRAGRSLSEATGRVPREERIDDFIHNPVYFRVTGLAAASDRELLESDEALRRACLAAGMMAMAGASDGRVERDEARVLQKELEAGFDLTGDDAAFLCQVAADMAAEGLDIFRLGQSLKDALDNDHRESLLQAMFRVAGAKGAIDSVGVERLRRLSDALGLSRNAFASAKRQTS